MQLKIMNTVDRSLQSTKIRFQSQLNFFQAQQLRVLALAILNLKTSTTQAGIRRYDCQDFHFSCSRNTLLSVAYRDPSALGGAKRTILETTTDGHLLKVSARLISMLLSTVQMLYAQAEQFTCLMETGEDPPEDGQYDAQLQRVQAEDIAAILRSLAEPIAQTLFAVGTTRLADYQITHDDLGLVLTRGEHDLVLIVRNNYVWNYSTTTRDWEFFQPFRGYSSSNVTSLR